MIKKLLNVIILIILFSCSKKHEREYFYGSKNKTIYEFNEKKLFKYNIVDSTKQDFFLKKEKDKIYLVNENNKFNLNYIKNKDSLWLIDYNELFINGIEIKLVKLNLKNTINKKSIYNKYWEFLDEKYQHNYFFKFENRIDFDFGDLYLKNKNHIEHIISFNLTNKTFFDTFNILLFNDPVLNGNYFVTNISNESLELKSLESNKKLKLKRYNSKIDNKIFGKWKYIESEDNSNILLSNSIFYFGQELHFDRKLTFHRKVIDSNSTSYKNYIELLKTSYAKPINLENRTLKFEFGLDSKYLFFKEPIKKIIKIEKLSKDTLIFLNNSLGKKKMIYVKIDD